MKTIYTHGGKFIIDKELLQDVEKTVQEFLERRLKLYDAINIPIQGELGEKAHIRIASNPNYGLVEGEDKVWAPIVDESNGEVYLEEDLRKVPNVYFESGFNIYIADGELSKIPPLRVIDVKHWKQLARALHRNAKEALEDHVWEVGMRGDIGQIVSGGPSDNLANRYRRILSASQDFYRGKIPLIDFINAITDY